MKETYYDVLGITPAASQAEIKSAWRAAVSRFHPDRTDGNAIQTVLFNRAYEVLSDPVARLAYDQEVASGEAPDGADPPADPADTDTRSDEGRAESRAHSDPGTPSSMPSWWGPQLRDTSITVVPDFEASRGPFGVAMLLWGVLWTGGLVALSSNGAGWLPLVAVGLCAVLLLPGRWRAMLPCGGLLLVAAVIGAVGVLLGGLSAADESAGWLVTAGAVALVGGIPIVRVLAEQWTSIAELNRLIDRETTLESNVWGTPGEPLFPELGENAPHNDLDRWAARSTAKLLEPVIDVPGSKFLYGTPSPDQPDLYVEQIAICGRHVALIESQAWGPGTYTLDEYGVVLCDGEHFPGGRPNVIDAAAQWQRHLNDAHVRGFLVVHAVSGAIDLAVEDGGLEILAASDVAEIIGGFLYEEAGTVNRRILMQVLVAVG